MQINEQIREEFRKIGDGSVRFIATRQEVEDFWLSKRTTELQEAYKQGYVDCGIRHIANTQEMVKFVGNLEMDENFSSERKRGFYKAIDLFINYLQGSI